MVYKDLSTEDLYKELQKCDEKRAEIKATAVAIKQELDLRKSYKKLQDYYDDLPDAVKETIVLKPTGISSDETIGTPGA